MTKRECAVVTAYTGIMCGSFNDFHQYAEELLGRPIYTHEFCQKWLWEVLKEKSREEFVRLGEEPKHDKRRNKKRI